MSHLPPGSPPDESDSTSDLRDRFRRTVPIAPPVDFDALFATAHPRWRVGRAASRESGIHPLIDKGIEIMRRPLSQLIVVGVICLAVALGWLWLPGTQSSATAFDKLVEKLVTAKTARYQIECYSEPGKLLYRGRVYFCAPGKARMETFADPTSPERVDEIGVGDLQTHKMLLIDVGQKVAYLENITGAEIDIPTSYFRRIQELLKKGAGSKVDGFERLPETSIEGKRVLGFRRTAAGSILTLWADPVTGHPLRVEQTGAKPGSGLVTWTKFEINVELDQALFSLTPPPGYDVRTRRDGPPAAAAPADSPVP